MRVKLLTCTFSALLLAGLTVGCSSGGDTKEKGTPLAEACNSFAKDKASLGAMEYLTHGQTVTDRGSEAEKVPASVRASLGQEGAGEDTGGVPLCRLSSVDDGRWAFSIYVRKALAIPSDRDDLGGGVTYYSTGALASATDARAALYFKCHGPSQAEAAVIAAELELPDDAPAEESGIRENQITVLNAAARAVAKELKCGTTGLVEDKPRSLQ